jgi:aryl-alcohol dehydrogenase-like predicted oxidoreductase
MNAVMEFCSVGYSGLRVSGICLGSMTFGHATDATSVECLVRAALDAGVILFDTADGYSNGESEPMLRRALDTRPREAVIATKVFNPTGPGRNE